MFTKAKKEQLKAKIMVDGPSGSGKTYGALRLATGLGGKIAVLDTENRSASLYADRFKFDVCDISAPYTPEKYIEVIKYASENYDILIIDSMTHEWSGEGGCLDIKDKIGPRFQDWVKVTPRHNAFISAIILAPIHVITTVRTKTGYEMGENNGKATVTKVGLQPITRDGFEYENTVVFTINENNFACSKKDRTSMFAGKDFQLTEEIGEQLSKWLDDGQSIQETLNIITERCKDLEQKEDWTTVREALVKEGLFSKPEQKDHMTELYTAWVDSHPTPEKTQTEFDKMVSECKDEKQLVDVEKFFEENESLSDDVQIKDSNTDAILKLQSEFKQSA